MLTYLKDNSYNIVKMMLNQFAIAVFGLMLALATSAHQTLLIFTSIFSIIFYLYLLYTMTWDIGAKDRIKVDYESAPKNLLSGLYMSLCANVPNLLLAVLVTVGYIFGRADGAFAYEWAGSMYGVAALISKLLNGMYIGITSQFFVDSIAAYFLCCIPAIAVCCISYYLGFQNIRLFGFLKLKKPEDDKKSGEINKPKMK